MRGRVVKGAAAGDERQALPRGGARNLIERHLAGVVLADPVDSEGVGLAVVAGDGFEGFVGDFGGEIAAALAAADGLGEAADEAVAEDAALIGAAGEVAAEATKEAQARTRAASITRSEAQILRYLPQPVPFSVIADKLGISRSAAKERAARLYNRLGVHSRDEAVSRARSLGLISAR